MTDGVKIQTKKHLQQASNFIKTKTKTKKQKMNDHFSSEIQQYLLYIQKDLAYLDMAHHYCILWSLLHLLCKPSHHTLPPVSYICVFATVFPACKTLNMCSIGSTLPSSHQLRNRFILITNRKEHLWIECCKIKTKVIALATQKKGKCL